MQTKSIEYFFSITEIKTSEKNNNNKNINYQYCLSMTHL